MYWDEDEMSRVEDRMSWDEDEMSRVEDRVSWDEDEMSRVEDRVSWDEDEMSRVEDRVSCDEDEMSRVEEEPDFESEEDEYVQHDQLCITTHSKMYTGDFPVYGNWTPKTPDLTTYGGKWTLLDLPLTQTRLPLPSACSNPWSSDPIQSSSLFKHKLPGSDLKPRSSSTLGLRTDMLKELTAKEYRSRLVWQGPSDDPIYESCGANNDLGLSTHLNLQYRGTERRGGMEEAIEEARRHRRCVQRLLRVNLTCLFAFLLMAVVYCLIRSPGNGLATERADDCRTCCLAYNNSKRYQGESHSEVEDSRSCGKERQATDFLAQFLYSIQ